MFLVDILEVKDGSILSSDCYCWFFFFFFSFSFGDSTSVSD